MAVSDVYFVLEQLDKDSKIMDFREHSYQNLKSIRPEDMRNLPVINAREFLRGLADVRPALLSCQSRKDLVDMLKGLATQANMAADSGSMTKKEMNIYCGVRDNTYQLLEMLDVNFRR